MFFLLIVTKQRDSESGQQSLLFQVTLFPRIRSIHLSAKLMIFFDSFHVSQSVSLFFQIDYPEVAEGIGPRHRFMSAYEQRIEPPDRRWQYLLFAAEPYETISFKVCRVSICFRSDAKLKHLWFTWCDEFDLFLFCFQVPSREIDKAETRFWTHWNRETKQVRELFSWRHLANVHLKYTIYSSLYFLIYFECRGCVFW